MNPTQKRLKISKRIAESLEGRVHQVVLGGSMGFGQDYSVTENSDIDMVVTIDREDLGGLQSSFFYQNQIPVGVMDLFNSGRINIFKVTQEINGVEVNVFTYETKGYTDFCSLQGELKGFSLKGPLMLQSAYAFDGSEIIFSRNVASHPGCGFTYQKPALLDGKFWAGVPRQEFLYSADVLYERCDFFTNLERTFWEKMIGQFVREFGDQPDLSKNNVLNTHYVYQNSPERLPPRVVSDILDRTNEELAKYICS